MINKKRFVKTFLELVSIDSPSGDEAKFGKVMAKKLTSLGGKVVFDKYGNIITKFAGDKKSEVLLINSHLDTVEPGRGIKPIVKGDKIFTDEKTILGSDDKAGLSIILEALTVIKEDKISHHPLEIVLTLGEEIGLLGAINLDYKKITAKKGVTFDGHGRVSNVTVAAPGNISVDAVVTGIAAHAGVEPEKGLSAIVIASEIISNLKLGRIDEETTANIGLITGGSARNAVPERVEIKGEMRSRDIKKLKKHADHFEAEFEKAAKKSKNAKIELEMVERFPPYNFTANSWIIQRIIKVFKKMGIKPDLGPTGGGSDVNIFISHGIEIVDVGVGVYDPHTVRENASIPEMLEATNFCVEFIKTE